MKSLTAAWNAQHRVAAVQLRSGTVPASWGQAGVHLVALMCLLMLCVIWLSSCERVGKGKRGKGDDKDDREKRNAMERKNEEKTPKTADLEKKRFKLLFFLP